MLSIILQYLLFINFVGFATFGIDKYKAIHNRWRIRESVLLGMALLGGSIGCLIGMYVFHHKTLHRSFTIGIPTILAAQLILGCTLFYSYTDHMPYQQDPVKLVRYQLDTLCQPNEDSLTDLIAVNDIFPNASNQQNLSEDVTSVFSNFFQSFSYQILNSQQGKEEASVTISFTTLDGMALAKEYSRQVLIKQIQNSASPASVDFSLEDCYLLLGNVLKKQDWNQISSEYTIHLSKQGKNWSIDSPKNLSNALTGDFSACVADPSLFTPSEVLSIHLDTLKDFDTEQLNRYLSLESLFAYDDDSKRSIAKALATQLHTYLNYEITGEELSSDGSEASVQLDLTSCDCSSIVSNYQDQFSSYLSTAQALEDGSSGRSSYSANLLCSCITENTSSITTSITVYLTNDGNHWRMEVNDEMSSALLGNLAEIITGVRCLES